MASFIQERIKIWQGLDNFRQVLLDILSHGVRNINQNTLNKLFSGYDLVLQDSRRDLLIKQIQIQIKQMDEGSEERLLLEQQMQELKSLDEELIIKKETKFFHYEFILKEKNNFKNLAGFVKIMSIDNPRHRALLSWQQQSREPVIFLAELLPDHENFGKEKIYFHISLSKDDGTAIIFEEKDKFMWTQIDAYEYSSMINAETGSISMNKATGLVMLEDANLTAAKALSKAETTNPEGVSIFANNVKLMQMYKDDLQKLSFDY
jgi:hypothetical protein